MTKLKEALNENDLNLFSDELLNKEIKELTLKEVFDISFPLFLSENIDANLVHPYDKNGNIIVDSFTVVKSTLDILHKRLSVIDKSLF